MKPVLFDLDDITEEEMGLTGIEWDRDPLVSMSIDAEMLLAG